MAVRREVEYDNGGDAGQNYSSMRVRTFDDGMVELMVEAGDAFDVVDKDGRIDVVLNWEQALHLRDLLNAHLVQPRKSESLIRERK